MTEVKRYLGIFEFYFVTQLCEHILFLEIILKINFIVARLMSLRIWVILLVLQCWHGMILNSYHRLGLYIFMLMHILLQPRGRRWDFGKEEVGSKSKLYTLQL